MVIQGVTYLSDFEAKKAIMEMARRLEAKGWLVAGDGSMSVRVGPQAVWVTVARETPIVPAILGNDAGIYGSVRLIVGE